MRQSIGGLPGVARKRSATVDRRGAAEDTRLRVGRAESFSADVVMCVAATDRTGGAAASIADTTKLFDETVMEPF